jgi:hypothetical protein
MNMGFKHDMPVSWNINPKIQYFHSFSKFKVYRDTLSRLYRKKRLLVSEGYKLLYNRKDTINKVTYAQGYYPGLSASLTPKFMGFINFQEKVNSIYKTCYFTFRFLFIYPRHDRYCTTILQGVEKMKRKCARAIFHL